MATLVDYEIMRFGLGNKLVIPFSENQLNPASYDVRLGKNLLIEKPDGSWAEATTPYQLEPGEFLLGETQEMFYLPNQIEAVFMLKSSRGREGFEHVLSGYIDPGYRGRITLELVNVNRYRKLSLEEGMLIGQIRFMYTHRTCDKPYSITGHYQNHDKVMPSLVDGFGRPTTNT
jgi:dCTP deaminase